MPSDAVQRVVRQLRADGEATHAYLGVRLGDAVSDEVTRLLCDLARALATA